MIVADPKNSSVVDRPPKDMTAGVDHRIWIGMVTRGISIGLMCLTKSNRSPNLRLRWRSDAMAESRRSSRRFGIKLAWLSLSLAGLAVLLSGLHVTRAGVR